MKNIQTYVALGVIVLVAGCSRELFVRKPVTASGEIGNPYIKYISPEPYWHYNFYPEPHWEYTYALYSFPYNVGFADFNCAEIDRPYWHGRHHDHKHRHDHGHDNKANNHKHHHGEIPGKLQPVKPIRKSGVATPSPTQVINPGKVPPVKRPPLLAEKPPVVKPIPVRPEPPSVKPEHPRDKAGWANPMPDHAHAHGYPKPVRPSDDLEKPPILMPTKAYEEKPMVENPLHTGQHQPAHGQHQHDGQSATAGLSKHDDDPNQNHFKPMPIREQPVAIRSEKANRPATIEKTPSTQQTHSVAKTPPMPVQEEKSALEPTSQPQPQPKERANTEPSVKSGNQVIELLPAREKATPAKVETRPQHEERMAIEPAPMKAHQPKIELPAAIEKPTEVMRPVVHELDIVTKPPAPEQRPIIERPSVYEKPPILEISPSHDDKVSKEPEPMPKRQPAAEPPAPINEKPAKQNK